MAVGGDAVIAERVAAGRPVLGICVGMQVLYEAGEEHGVRSLGLGLLPGEVLRSRALPSFPTWGGTSSPPPRVQALRTAWSPNVSTSSTPTPRPRRPGDTAAEHGSVFAAAVEEGPLSATQFHPEKSADAGARVLANWLGQL